MTPFAEDVRNVYECAVGITKHIVCYFFGHKYRPWEAYYHMPIGALRYCKRCEATDHDSQMSHRELPDTKGGGL